MIGGQAAPMPKLRMAHAPSQEEVKARLDALETRVPSRRASDDRREVDGPDGPKDPQEAEAETMARLHALEARLNAGGPRP